MRYGHPTYQEICVLFAPFGPRHRSGSASKRARRFLHVRAESRIFLLRQLAHLEPRSSQYANKKS